MMTDQIQIFNNSQFGDIRITEVGNQPFFVAKDICDALEIGNNRQAISKLDEDEKGVSLIMTPSGSQEMNVVNESGLYNLIFQSRKPQARAFRKWVTSEVLPSLRKDGFYGMGAMATQNATPLGAEAPKIEWYNNTACISAGWLVRAGIMTMANYSRKVYTGRIKRMRRANNGRVALIAFDTLPEKYRAKIREQYGVIGVPTLEISSERTMAVMAEICRIEDATLRLNLLNKLIY